jgi:integrase
MDLTHQPKINMKKTNKKAVQRVIPTLQIIDELIISKRLANRREEYLTSLKNYLKGFARIFPDLALVTAHGVEKWLAECENMYSRQTRFNRVNTLLSYAKRRDILKENPCERIDRITVDKPVPVILTVEQSRLLYEVCPAGCRPYLVLAMFAGIRPDEVIRLDWKDINLETKTVQVDGKTRRRRIVPLEPIAASLLSLHPVKTGPVAPSKSTVKRWQRTARHVIGYEKFPHDVLRHTAASYLIALYDDAGKVAMRLGNSVGILLTHYHNPVSKADCERFWKLEMPGIANDQKEAVKGHPVSVADLGNPNEAAQPVSIKSSPVNKKAQPVSHQVGPETKRFFGRHITRPDTWYSGGIQELSSSDLMQGLIISKQCGISIEAANTGLYIIRENEQLSVADPLTVPWLN